jgi:hypothetical protein
MAAGARRGHPSPRSGYVISRAMAGYSRDPEEFVLIRDDSFGKSKALVIMATAAKCQCTDRMIVHVSVQEHGHRTTP